MGTTISRPHFRPHFYRRSGSRGGERWRPFTPKNRMKTAIYRRTTIGREQRYGGRPLRRSPTIASRWSGPPEDRRFRSYSAGRRTSPADRRDAAGRRSPPTGDAFSASDGPSSPPRAMHRDGPVRSVEVGDHVPSSRTWSGRASSPALGDRRDLLPETSRRASRTRRRPGAGRAGRPSDADRRRAMPARDAGARRSEVVWRLRRVGTASRRSLIASAAT